MKQTWVILGASSAIARAFARRMAENGSDLMLCGRDKADLSRLVEDISLRGEGAALALPLDVTDSAGFGAIIDAMAQRDGQLNIAIFTGVMPEQTLIDEKAQLIEAVAAGNFTGPAEFLHRAAPLLEARECGVIVGVGSVAGDRGRLGNYVYGAAKAGFHTYLSGLRNRLGRRSIQVLTVKPGFVDTGLTWGREGMFLVASPEDIARAIERGIRRKRNILYAPWFWIVIMGVIRAVPERVFKKLRI